MKNLPVFSQDLLKGCKVFAIAGALSLCCACGGSEPAETPDSNVSASPMSGEVEVKGDEVASDSGEATAEEAGTEEGSKNPVGKAIDEAGDKVAEAAQDMADQATAAVEAKAEEAKQDSVSSHFMASGRVRDPFDKYYGAPAVGTSLSGGVKPSADKGKQAVSSAYKKQIANKIDKKNPEAVVKVNRPDVKVTGILRSGNVYKAILQGPEKAIMVSSGETIGGYRIASVSAHDVTLVYKNKYKFVIPMEKEVFGNTGAPTAPAAATNATPF